METMLRKTTMMMTMARDSRRLRRCTHHNHFSYSLANNRDTSFDDIIVSMILLLIHAPPFFD